MDVSYELIIGVSFGVENFIDEEYGSAWVISLFIFRVILLPKLPD